MLSGDKGLSVKTLLSPAQVHAYVRDYIKDATHLPQQAVANFNKILPALEQSARLTQLYSHPNTLPLLCEAMFSSRPDLHLLDERNGPAQLDSLWHLLLSNFATHHWPMRTIYNGASLLELGRKFDDSFQALSLHQLRKLYCDEQLFLGYFAFALLHENKHQAELCETIAWISKRTSVVVQSEKLKHLRPCVAPNEEQLTVQISNLGVLAQHPCSSQYSFYDDRLKWYFAAHFVAACFLRRKDDADLIDDTLAANVRQFILQERENTYLDEFWFYVHAAFPLATGTHARAEFNKISITTRAECSAYITKLFKLTEREIPESFIFQLTWLGENQVSIKSQKTSSAVNNHIIDFFNTIYVHFESREKCKLIMTAIDSELIFISKSQQEIQNIIFAFKQALGLRLKVPPVSFNLFASHKSAEIATQQSSMAVKHN